MPPCPVNLNSPGLDNWIEIVKLAISFLTLASIIIAFLSYRANVAKQAEDRARDKDKELLAQAQKSLQWAYETLTSDGKKLPPEPDRLNWLTAARHIVRQRRLAAEITTETYKTVHSEITEYWRHKFYLALSHERLANPAYFIDAKHPEWPENIQPDSALVVADFAHWNDQTVDPLDSVDREQLVQSGSGTKGPYVGFGLKAYLERLSQAKAALTARKKEKQ